MRFALLTSLLVVACATSRLPASLRGYDVLVEGKDEQSRELARAMRGYGFRVREKVRGGSRPTAALIYFTFSDPGPGEPSWLHVRLADTRSGVIVGAATVPLDSQVTSPRSRANAAVLALVAP
ncbi:MAG TPA: hypothetical protein VGQ48_08400 [Gemmatimonadales bacterium]|nr:hypothetical protein [Gemmatimonadales bacterium]